MGVRETCQHTGDRRLVCQQLSVKGVWQRIRIRPLTSKGVVLLGYKLRQLQRRVRWGVKEQTGSLLYTPQLVIT